MHLPLSRGELDAVRGRFILSAVAQMEAGLGLPALAAVAAAPGCFGAARLLDCGEDCPDFALTCAWHRGGVWVATASGFRGRARAGRPVWLPPGAMPWRLRTWGRLARAAAAAPSCEGRELMIGGPLFFHAVAAGRWVEVAKWNLAGRSGGLHWALIRGYNWVGWVRWLRSRFPARVVGMPNTELSQAGAAHSHGE